ncbi:HAD family hydrolase [Noviherbaspirillum sp. Root189]|uniref:HAD family hydrolase n=1 Tax=Noviherbaspirillum sp. Root189 TaxID=1736487 RepID=UPI00070CE6E8|nr:HAD family hydrolase [Noviherbaspirillum sp. Root189]KRB83952.1 hydrolase [Noviherbaspirillum sp. Root189]
MSVIKAVLFDLDDTLWPIVPVIKRAENLLFEWLQANVPTVAARVSIDGMRARRQMLMETDPVYQLDLRALRHAVLKEAFMEAGEELSLVDEAMHVFSRARNEVPLFPEVEPTLRGLRERYALASVSNGVSDLKAIGIAHLFDATIAAHSFGLAKPDAAIFHAACEALNVAPGEAVYVGDDPRLDVDGAQKAGLRAVWMNRKELQPLRPLPQGITPDAECSNLVELDHWLQQLR